MGLLMFLEWAADRNYARLSLSRQRQRQVNDACREAAIALSKYYLDKNNYPNTLKELGNRWHFSLREEFITVRDPKTHKEKKYPIRVQYKKTSEGYELKSSCETDSENFEKVHDNSIDEFFMLVLSKTRKNPNISNVYIGYDYMIIITPRYKITIAELAKLKEEIKPMKAEIERRFSKTVPEIRFDVIPVN